VKILATAYDWCAKMRAVTPRGSNLLLRRRVRTRPNAMKITGLGLPLGHFVTAI
jgi:hypothetical protein